MKFSIYSTVKSAKPFLCDKATFEGFIYSAAIKETIDKIRASKDKNEIAELKKTLPVVTWQAYFKGRRKSEEAVPSGLFMLDIDHVENPSKFYGEKIMGKEEENHIVYAAVSPSGHGIRLVAECLPGLDTIANNQKALSEQLDVEIDEVCKDWARCSFLSDAGSTLYLNWSLFEREPKVLLKVTGDQCSVTSDQGGQGTGTGRVSQQEPVPGPVDQREGLFGGAEEYQGLKYGDIAKEWLRMNGGEPVEGERNTKLYKLATRMRYICDFNQATLLRVMPRYGLSEDEMKVLIHSACSSMRSVSMPKDLSDTLDMLHRGSVEVIDMDEEDVAKATEVLNVPPLPPVFKEWYEVAPEDFKIPVTLCQLPILGTLGSRLRAKYLDGEIHSPSFQVSLEAPQASGKSFVRKLVDYELASLKEHDEQEREKEREYDKKIKEINLTKTKVTAKNKEEIIGQRPQTIIRYVPATMSITKMLMRMQSAQGLHLIAFSEEIDTVYKAYKRQFSCLSDALRNSFDNSEYGQDYASENSFSGMVKLYYNTLYCGTPNAMRRFYPDLEDGLVSRVLFVTLADQFGKKMPVWGELDAKAKQSVDVALERLSEVSLSGEEVQPEHEMDMDFVNKALQEWLDMQQAIAVKMNDRTRDIFCRRSAVVGFRAAMLAFYLWDERRTRTIKKNVSAFAVWVANCMLNQHLLRFKVNDVSSNTFLAQTAYDQLKDEFTMDELSVALGRNGVKSPEKMVVYKWRLLGVLSENLGTKRSPRYKKLEGRA